MSTETGEHDWARGTSAVDRFKGAAFEYVCLATALFGIVTLLVLLGFVAVDAFELRGVDPSWYAAFLVVLVAPTVALWWRVRGTPAADVAKTSVGGTLLGVGLGTFLVIAFVIVSPAMWATYVLVAFVPAVAVIGFRDRLAGPVHPQSFALGLVVLGVLVATALLGPITTVLGTAPLWLLYLLTLTAPVAGTFRWWSLLREHRVGDAVVAVLVGGTILVGVADALGAPSISPVIPFLVGLSIPIAVVVADALERPPAARVGLLAPVVVVVGLAAGFLVTDLLGSAGPDSWLRWAFLRQGPSRSPVRAGLYPPIVGSIFMLVVMVVAVFPLGVGAAIYLEEYAPRNRLTRLIQVNLANLAGVPSVVYGLLGLAILARRFGFGLGTVLTAGLTVGLLVLPIVIISSQEAIRSVPTSVRQASYGMGASRWQTTRNVVLPEAFPGILTGTILALGRAIGETAPLIMIGAATAVSSPPTWLFDTVTAMPLQLYAWRGHFNPDFRYGVLAAGVITLLVVLLGMNTAAIVLRNRYEKR